MHMKSKAQSIINRASHESENFHVSSRFSETRTKRDFLGDTEHISEELQDKLNDFCRITKTKYILPNLDVKTRWNNT